MTDILSHACAIPAVSRNRKGVWLARQARASLQLHELTFYPIQGYRLGTYLLVIVFTHREPKQVDLQFSSQQQLNEFLMQ